MCHWWCPKAKTNQLFGVVSPTANLTEQIDSKETVESYPYIDQVFDDPNISAVTDVGKEDSEKQSKLKGSWMVTKMLRQKLF